MVCLRPPLGRVVSAAAAFSTVIFFILLLGCGLSVRAYAVGSHVTVGHHSVTVLAPHRAGNQGQTFFVTDDANGHDKLLLKAVTQPVSVPGIMAGEAAGQVIDHSADNKVILLKIVPGMTAAEYLLTNNHEKLCTISSQYPVNLANAVKHWMQQNMPQWYHDDLHCKQWPSLSAFS
ncbi:hypothetical protein HK405_010049 [Cladochytrium tenue]|nr:hypothetical protein HK405_010049 [Cladochytrium tenue]